ncbi:hypothetical protein NZD89_06030 [Alicyclobacillus fastidiosus]|uniref:Uncharacterized protein n=1 Tax=Alicyclobacillus fastidiosus TaxID=392011 RepID=A0ABY6ZJ77_9BACL|nr:hypothetical protein [Alicyclobacillus fastidiosus]WAH42973.1 hypothetical protein NZD89_06030 [Alicyclobacillus fastidiosus]GMA64940.1 hypothetical protein GCM10025859_53800 [Alicyclobacillus fastidiosus]
MGENSQEVQLAIATNDIIWMKATIADMNEGIKNLQEALERAIKTQDEKYATKVEVETVRKDVENLKQWRWKIGGALGLIGMVIGWVASLGHNLPQFHPGFPFTVFSKYADFTMPQVYWDDMQLSPTTALNECLAYYNKYDVPIVPIGQLYGPVTPDQIKSFISGCSGLSGYSFWDYQHCTAAMWQAVLDGQGGSKVEFSPLTVEINGLKQPDGIDVNSVTYVNWGALEVVKVPFTNKGNGLFTIRGKDVQGVIQNNVTYFPWYIALVGYTPVRITGGWNFTNQQPAPAPSTPTNAAIASQVTNLLQQVENLLKGVK